MLPQMMPLPWVLVFFLIFFCLYTVFLCFTFYSVNLSSKVKVVKASSSSMPW
uniref:ATP synthase F0 subunit 8 n=1 Tax=Blomia tropicalis TaxID=40697 RepID=UPI001FF349DE|nr:ATP synthase F0 subunit 8 [Blomia tropicalis]UOG85305.1 ATP synthase F0 subunit 8 [Blomia tropicalis]